MDLALRGRRALVCAASKGLGRASAEALAAEGARVAIVARAPEPLEAAAREIHAQTGAEVIAIPGDVSDGADIERLHAEALGRLGGVDILVNNAGGPPPGRFVDFDDAAWRSAFELNLLSAIRLTRLVLPAMQAQRWGRIVNITSIAVKQPIPHLILSNTVRVGVVAFAKTLAPQVAADGVTINNVCPGIHRTDRVRKLAEATARPGETADACLARMGEELPMKRLGEPAEFGGLVAFLCGGPAAFITGATIQADGGAYAGLM
ncbi:MAG: SDR family oxidoreductase [Myxococcales bacterium]|nr:SDR family oxidoreductase [Myxococcales bacterium]